jgi:hypothetical protein
MFCSLLIPSHLDEMKDVELMNRVDTKFLISRKVFDKILPELAQGYRSLEIKEQRMIEYSTLYFDTPNYKFLSGPSQQKRQPIQSQNKELCFFGSIFPGDQEQVQRKNR